MKGVILCFHPQARIVDLCHQVGAYDVLGGALALAASYRYFPPGTVHLAVVDPGVGSARRALLAQAGEWLFLAPDNGLLELVWRRHPHRVLALRTEEFALQPISNTFHARDVFAPAAGRLASGARPEDLGSPITDYARLEIPPVRRPAPGRLEGAVLQVDRFGNLITNLEPAELPAAFLLRAGGALVTTLRSSYAAALPGEIFAIAGSSGYLEISMNQASAAETAGAAPGTIVEVLES